ncbi:MAG TPA: hypothetical protein VLZ83_17070 [Edaphocola sp.]|nr:hypothetical protein [Edaphocola sp.]
MDINIKGLSDILKLIADLFEGVKKLGKVTVSHRQKLIKSLGDTAELIDQTLTILKGHLARIVSELQSGNLPEAKELILELNNHQDWESRYRQFQMCEPLMQAGRELETLLNRELVNKVAIKDSQKLEQLIYDYIRNEGAAGKLIGETLTDLSKLASQVDTDPQAVSSEIEKAKSDIQKWRDKFIKLEKQLRKAI